MYERLSFVPAKVLTSIRGRRRKIRCIYDDGNIDICQECALHERQCIKQGLVRGTGNASLASTSNVKVQVTRLESAVEKLAREKERKSHQHKGSTSQASNDEEVPDSFFLNMDWKDNAPIYSLFDNETVWNPCVLFLFPLLTLFRLLKILWYPHMVWI